MKTEIGWHPVVLQSKEETMEKTSEDIWLGVWLLVEMVFADGGSAVITDETREMAKQYGFEKEFPIALKRGFEMGLWTMVWENQNAPLQNIERIELTEAGLALGKWLNDLRRS